MHIAFAVPELTKVGFWIDPMNSNRLGHRNRFNKVGGMPLRALLGRTRKRPE